MRKPSRRSVRMLFILLEGCPNTLDSTKVPFREDKSCITAKTAVKKAAVASEQPVTLIRSGFSEQRAARWRKSSEPRPN